MRRLTCLAFASAMLATPAQAKPSFDGVYGIVCESDETGDLGGIQVKARIAGEKITLDILVCEGWCYKESVLHGVTDIREGRFSFLTADRLIEGGTGKAISRPVTYSGSFQRRALLLSAKGKTFSFEPVTLKPTQRERCARGSVRARQPLLEGWGE